MIPTSLKTVFDEGISRVSALLSIFRESMVWLIPCVMVAALSQFVAVAVELYYGQGFWLAEKLHSLDDVVVRTLPYLITASISYMLAIRYSLPRSAIILLCTLYLAIASEVAHIGAALPVYQSFFAIVMPFGSVPLIFFFFRLFSSHKNENIIVKESFQIIIPGLMAALIIIHLSVFSLRYLASLPLNDIIFNYISPDNAYAFGIVFSFLNSFFWFLGIHAHHVMGVFIQALNETPDLFPLSINFLRSFVFIGGSGSTLALAIVLLLFSKHRSVRLLALSSLFTSMINVNELLLFGLPIILNFRFLRPFLLAPIINVVLALLAVDVGFIEPTLSNVYPYTPVFLNSWLASGGDWHAVVLQVALLFISCTVYFPSVRYLNKQDNIFYLRSLDTTYIRCLEEAKSVNNDSVLISRQKEKEMAEVERKIQIIGRTEFFVQYQPQISQLTGKVIGCESLLRAKNDQGEILYPNAFLPWLEKANLMKDIDLWVVRRVVRDLKRREALGVNVNTSVNITVYTLMDDQCMEQIVRLIEPVSQYLDFEITEGSLLQDKAKLAGVFERLHELGCHIHIDDFGTGYSSMSYLNLFDIDAIKIDRSFVQALDTEKGRKVFSGIYAVANELAMDVVVEGVETQEQLNFVSQFKQVSVQGWYYSKPLNEQDFIDYVMLRQGVFSLAG